MVGRKIQSQSRVSGSVLSVDGTGTTNSTNSKILSCCQIISKINNHLQKHQTEKEEITATELSHIIYIYVVISTEGLEDMSSHFRAR